MYNISIIGEYLLSVNFKMYKDVMILNNLALAFWKILDLRLKSNYFKKSFTTNGYVKVHVHVHEIKGRQFQAKLKILCIFNI